MSTLDRDYFLSIWQKGCDWLVENAGGHEPLIGTLRAIISEEVSGLNETRVTRSDLLWSVTAKLWSHVIGDDQLGERRPPLQGSAADADMLDYATIKDATIAPYGTVDELIYALMQVSVDKRPSVSFSSVSTWTHGGLAESLWAKPSHTTSALATTQTSVANPDIQTKHGSGSEPMVGQATTNRPQATEPVLKLALPSLGNPPMHPAACNSYEVKLPPEINVANFVVPYMAIIGKLLGVFIHILKGQNAVKIRAHKAKIDRGLGKEVYEFDNEYKARRAYDIFLQWTADMYQNEEARDLAQFVQGVLAKEADEMRIRSKRIAEFIDEKVNVQCRVARPVENPENSYFFTPKPGSALSKHKSHPELRSETRTSLGDNCKADPSGQRTMGRHDVGSWGSRAAQGDSTGLGISIDDSHHDAAGGSQEFKQRVEDIWELATYDEATDSLDDMWHYRGRFEELGEQMLGGQISMQHFFQEMHTAFFSGHYSGGDFGEKFEATIRVVQNLLLLVLEQTELNHTEARKQIAHLTRSLRLDAGRHHLRNKRRRVDEASRVIGREDKLTIQPRKRRKDHKTLYAADSQDANSQALPKPTESLDYIKVKVEEDETAGCVSFEAIPRQDTVKPLEYIKSEVGVESG
ncbi:hypothetical protein PG995_012971 [Apiospora arundinis]